MKKILGKGCPKMGYFFALSLLTGMILAGCGASGVNSKIELTSTPVPTPSPMKPTESPTMAAPTPAGMQVTITGWLNTVWNGEPHYFITDDQGLTTQLLLDDEIAKPLGGPLQLDRKRITIVGEIVSDSPRIVRVLSVQFAN